MSALSLSQIDQNHLIHSVYNPKEHEEKGVRIIESASGVYLRDRNGRELMDAFSGLWCVNAGYGHESIVRAATRQLECLPYATNYFGFSSEPAIRLAQRLIELAPASLNRVYFSLGGSDAVDAAIKYIVHYYNAIGEPHRKHFISLERGYHGSSAVGAGLTALSNFHRNFDLPQGHQHYIPSTYPYRHPDHGNDAAIIAASVAALESKVREIGQERVAAFFCEPIQGSGGVIVPPRGWLSAMREACRRLGILFVVDEVITGFCRTGPMFACEHEEVDPDLMTIAKGLTSGYAPMGAVLMCERVYRGIASGCAPGAVVGHGQTYSAHPVSAAIGLEVLRLYTEGGLMANGKARGVQFQQGLTALADWGCWVRWSLWPINLLRRSSIPP
jgi:adenosylmethionine-8-amino-7-oxononanoate aminotransferase